MSSRQGAHAQPVCCRSSVTGGARLYPAHTFNLHRGDTAQEEGFKDGLDTAASIEDSAHVDPTIKVGAAGQQCSVCSKERCCADGGLQLCTIMAVTSAQAAAALHACQRHCIPALAGACCLQAALLAQAVAHLTHCLRAP